MPAPPDRTCRLTLTITESDPRHRDEVYTLRRIKGGPRGWSLRSGDGTAHRVTKDQWGVLRCTCDEDTSGVHRLTGECVHAKALIAAGLIAPSFRAPNKTKDFFEAVI